MNKFIWMIFAVDLAAGAGTAVTLIALLTDTTLFANESGGRIYYFITLGLGLLIFIIALTMLFMRSLWTIRIHDILAFLFFFAFPIGTGYTVAYIIKLRKELVNLVEARPIGQVPPPITSTG